MSIYRKIKIRGSSGKRIDPNQVAKEDAAAKEAKKQAKRFDRLPDETDERYAVRMRKIQRSKMTGAEVMAFDVLIANLDRQEKDNQRLREEPNPRGEITGVNSNDGNRSNMQVQVKFDPQHPMAPNREGEITIQGTSIWQAHIEDGEPGTKRLSGLPETGMTGILKGTRNFRDGIGIHWQFIVDPT